MKINKILNGTVALFIAGTLTTACTDQIAFGDASLDKAASSTATLDTVFSNAQYARQFVVGIYSRQYYGLPYTNGGDKIPHAANPYTGKFDALTDCWHQFWNGAGVYGQYYAGGLTTYVNRDDGLDGPLYSFDKEYQWWGIRSSLIFEANVDRVPSMEASEKAKLIAETKCLRAAYYFDTFLHYGGIPIIDHALESNEINDEFPRKSVEDCVNYMVQQLDEAIAEVERGDVEVFNSFEDFKAALA